MQTFHRFAHHAAFVAACDEAGWPRDHTNAPVPPAGVALDIIGPWTDPPTVVDGVMTAGATDARWHVNALWAGDAAPEGAWAAAEITPASPGRVFAGA